MRILAQDAEVEHAARIFSGRPGPFGKFREAEQVLGFVLKVVGMLGAAGPGHGEKDSQDSRYERTGHSCHEMWLSRKVATRGISGRRKDVIIKDVLSLLRRKSYEPGMNVCHQRAMFQDETPEYYSSSESRIGKSEIVLHCAAR